MSPSFLVFILVLAPTCSLKFTTSSLGDNLTLHCYRSSHYTTSSVTWQLLDNGSNFTFIGNYSTRNGVFILDPTKYDIHDNIIQLTNTALLIRNVTINDFLTYRCTFECFITTHQLIQVTLLNSIITTTIPSLQLALNFVVPLTCVLITFPVLVILYYFVFQRHICKLTHFRVFTPSPVPFRSLRETC